MDTKTCAAPTKSKPAEMIEGRHNMPGYWPTG